MDKNLVGGLRDDQKKSMPPLFAGLILAGALLIFFVTLLELRQYRKEHLVSLVGSSFAEYVVSSFCAVAFVMTFMFIFSVAFMIFRKSIKQNFKFNKLDYQLLFYFLVSLLILIGVFVAFVVYRHFHLEVDYCEWLLKLLFVDLFIGTILSIYGAQLVDSFRRKDLSF